MSDPTAPPPFEKLALGFGVAIAAATYVYWTLLGFERGEGWTSVAASRALVGLGGACVLAVILRLAVYLNAGDRP